MRERDHVECEPTTHWRQFPVHLHPVPNHTNFLCGVLSSLRKAEKHVDLISLCFDTSQLLVCMNCVFAGQCEEICALAGIPPSAAFHPLSFQVLHDANSRPTQNVLALLACCCFGSSFLCQASVFSWIFVRDGTPHFCVVSNPMAHLLALLLIKGALGVELSVETKARFWFQSQTFM